MTRQNCSNPVGNGLCSGCAECAATEFPPVSALGVAERFRDADKVHPRIIDETYLVVLGSTLGMLFAVIFVAVFVVWLTL